MSPEQERDLAWLRAAQANDDRGMESLYRTYYADIEHAARDVALTDPDDSFGVAQLAFVEAIRDFDTDRELISFRTHAGSVMRRALREARDREQAVTVPVTAVRRYYAIMRDAGSFDVAYARVRLGGLGMSAGAFLATHHAVAASCDVDDPDVAADVRQRPADPHTEPDPFYAAELLSMVPAVEERILRLRFDFGDVPTQNARLMMDVAPGTLMTYNNIGTVIGVSRARTQYMYHRAIATIKANVTDTMNQE